MADDDTIVVACGCVVPRHYLPLSGGDRMYICDHERKWIVRGRVEKLVHFKIEERKT
jgi:hypothetical protein